MKYNCPRCEKDMSGMLPPIDAELVTCGRCGVAHWVSENGGGVE